MDQDSRSIDIKDAKSEKKQLDSYHLLLGRVGSQKRRADVLALYQ